MNNKHLFFDLDRTLWDFEKNSKQALKKLFSHFELSSERLEFAAFYEKYFRVNQEMWREYGVGKISKEELRIGRFEKTLLKLKLPKTKAEEMAIFYTTHSPYQTNLIPGALELLENLKREKYTMHIITNGFREVQEIKIKTCKIDHYFDVVVCSEDVHTTKPDPKIFTHALTLAKATKENSAMIGDDYNIDYLGALKFGMKAVYFNYQGQRKIRKEQDCIEHLYELPAKLPWIFKEF